MPQSVHNRVEEVPQDIAASMISAVRRAFPKAHQVTDRFQVQKLASDGVQELRIKYRWQALDEENDQIAKAKEEKSSYTSEVLANGDTVKQLLARSRYLLFKHKSKWSRSQLQRAILIFERYPRLSKAYDLSHRLSDIFRICKSKEHAFKKLALWYNEVEESGIDSFKTVSRSIQTHYLSILYFFISRSTNTSAKSFSAKIKAFKATFRGVRDTAFFLFRLANIYA